MYNGNLIVSAFDAQNDTLTQKAPFQVSVPGAADTAVTPEPNTLLLLVTGLAGATLLHRRIT